LTPEQQDQVFGALYEVTLNQLSGAASPTATNPAEQLQWVSEQKAKALEPLLTPAQMESFRQQQNVQMKFMKEILGKMDASNTKK
jgi:hypothetical protein